MTDSETLRSVIKASGMKYGFLAKKIGISAYSLQRKIDNQVDFKSSESARLADVLNLSGENLNSIFFANRGDL